MIRPGQNIAIKVPAYRYDETVAFYRDKVGLTVVKTLETSAAFAFGAVTLWIDRVATQSQVDVWLELNADDPGAAMATLGGPRRDGLEPLDGVEGHWTSDPAGTVLLVAKPVAAEAAHDHGGDVRADVDGASVDGAGEPAEPSDMARSITIHTDGACKGNPGPGGWGALIESGGAAKELCGGEPATTNNRMELMAAIEALKALKGGPHDVALITDSTYVRDGVTKWIHAWKRKGWKTAAGKPVKNEDLWKALDAAAARHRVDWRWVKGHAGDPGNERADALANEGLEKARAAA